MTNNYIIKSRKKIKISIILSIIVDVCIVILVLNNFKPHELTNTNIAAVGTDDSSVDFHMLAMILSAIVAFWTMLFSIMLFYGGDPINREIFRVARLKKGLVCILIFSVYLFPFTLSRFVDREFVLLALLVIFFTKISLAIRGSKRITTSVVTHSIDSFFAQTSELDEEKFLRYNKIVGISVLLYIITVLLLFILAPNFSKLSLVLTLLIICIASAYLMHYVYLENYGKLLNLQYVFSILITIIGSIIVFMWHSQLLNISFFPKFDGFNVTLLLFIFYIPYVLQFSKLAVLVNNHTTRKNLKPT